VKAWRIVHVDLLKRVLCLALKKDKEEPVFGLVPLAAARLDDCCVFRAAALLRRLVG
jgi:hypothetical protein